ncbi:MAG: glycosyltransferase family 2 protein [Legionellales bacterium]|nr:glycosyltransferase family 2 protein [Legionellales bacterium]
MSGVDKKSESIDLSVIVPVYKEATNIQPFLLRMEAILSKMKLAYEIIFCLDPSPDQTEQVIQDEIERNLRIKLLSFSRRFGQPAATMAGILYCKGNACVVIDVDLQDPPELIETMYHKFQEGYEVVYAKRTSRKGETLIKKLVSYLGYKIINKLTDLQIPTNTGDFRIMSRRIIEELRALNETHGFLRGLVAFVGFKQSFVEYDRDERLTGKGNYNRYLGSLKIGLNGLISFSSRPLQLMSAVGAIVSGLSFFLGVWYLFQKLIGMPLTPGLSTVVLVITFFSGMQLLCLGLIGEYIGRIYEEVKRRPLYIVDKVIDKMDVI